MEWLNEAVHQGEGPLELVVAGRARVVDRDGRAFGALVKWVEGDCRGGAHRGPRSIATASAYDWVGPLNGGTNSSR